MGSSTVGPAKLTASSKKGEVHEQAKLSSGPSTKKIVYVNYRAPDSKDFVSSLEDPLRRVCCKPVLDGEEPEKGGDASKSIEAVSEADVLVVIFSPNYAKSKHCLNQLCDMVTSKKPLISVFYNVEPTKLLKTYAKAFREHLKNGRKADVERWRAGLEEAAKTGLTLTRDNKQDTQDKQLVMDVGDAVSEALPKSPPIAKHYVGLEDRSKRVIDISEKMEDANVGVVGICGMNGIGKTAVARDVFNREKVKYGSCCFLGCLDKGQETKVVPVMDPQMKMMTDLVGVDEKKMEWDFDRIRKLGKKVLLVVDDITKRQQFDELVPDLKGLPAGSRVFITSLESGVLTNIMLNEKNGVSRSFMSNVERELYFVPGLNDAESLELFLWRAFEVRNIEDIPCKEFRPFVGDITKVCSGSPNLLEGMGDYLSCMKDLPGDGKYWREVTDGLKEMPLKTEKRRALETEEKKAWDEAVSEMKQKKALRKWYLSLDETEQKAWDEYMKAWDEYMMARDEYMKAVHEEVDAAMDYSFASLRFNHPFRMSKGPKDEVSKAKKEKDERKKAKDERQKAKDERWEELKGRREALDEHEKAWNENNLWDKKTKALGEYEKVCKEIIILDECEKENDLIDSLLMWSFSSFRPLLETETEREEMKIRMQVNNGMWREENEPNKISWTHISGSWDSVFWDRAHQLSQNDF